jgi:carboxypeptidase C (cathepsin A)
MKRQYKSCVLAILTMLAAEFAYAQRPDGAREPEIVQLPADVNTHQTLQLQEHLLSFTATAGSIRLREGKDLPLADVAFIAYQAENADTAIRPVTFVLNGGPGMASAWLQMGAVGPWRVAIDGASNGPSAPAIPIANPDTWLDVTDLVFIDPPATGYSRIVSSDSESRRRLLSVGGDVDALAETIRIWLDRNSRNVSPKYIVGESYGGFRAPRLARKLASDHGVAVAGLVLLSPLLDSHNMSGYADPLQWADLLPSEVAAARARRGPVAWSDMSDVETYAMGEYLVDVLRGPADTGAVDRLTGRVTDLTGLDPALVRRLGGRIDRSVFQRHLVPGQVGSAYDATITRPDPDSRARTGSFPDPVLDGFAPPVTGAMLAVYTGKLNWHPETTYHLSNPSVFSAWDWGHGMGRPESLRALNAARSLDPHMRVLIAHGLFDLITPYSATERILRLMPAMTTAIPIMLRVYPGGHMFYFNDASRAALHADAKAVFDPADETGAVR